MENELKPCPFCGGEAKLMTAMTDDGEGTISVVCQKCHIGIFRARSMKWDGWKLNDCLDAVYAWNRRANDG